MAKQKKKIETKQPRARDEKGRFKKFEIVQPKPKPSAKKSTPQQAPEQIKDPKKVQAGKIRQEQAIRDKSGKFANPILVNEIKKTLLATKKVDVSKINADQTAKINELLKDAKVKPADVKKFYDQNKKVFEDLQTFGKLKGTSKNSNQIEKAITDYKGKIFLNNGKKIIEVSKSEAKLKLISFKSFLSNNINVVDFTIKPTLSIDGTLTINLPDEKKLLKDLKKYFGVTKTEDLEEFTGAEISEALEEILNGIYNGESDLIIYAS